MAVLRSSIRRLITQAYIPRHNRRLQPEQTTVESCIPTHNLHQVKGPVSRSHRKHLRVFLTTRTPAMG